MSALQVAARIIMDEHQSVSSVLRSLGQMVQRGPGDEPERFFDVLRAMLFYIDEFPERMHHPKESDLLFPRLLRRAPELLPVIQQLEKDHLSGETNVRNLQHMLLAWELLGEARREPFEKACADYVGFYLEHMRLEESRILPAARELLSAQDWEELAAAFRTNQDPLSTGCTDPHYDRLFTRIVIRAPAPIGVGPA